MDNQEDLVLPKIAIDAAGDTEKLWKNLGFLDAPALKISSVIHKAHIDVNEEGCSAAAASFNLEAFKYGGMENASLNVFGEMHEMIHAQSTGKQLGEMAADICRNGTESPVTCMKPLRYKRGFYGITF